MIARLAAEVLSGEVLSAKEAFFLASVEGAGLFGLFSAAGEIREKFRRNRVDLCSIINAKIRRMLRRLLLLCTIIPEQGRNPCPSPPERERNNAKGP